VPVNFKSNETITNNKNTLKSKKIIHFKQAKRKFDPEYDLLATGDNIIDLLSKRNRKDKQTSTNLNDE